MRFLWLPLGGITMLIFISLYTYLFFFPITHESFLLPCRFILRHAHKSKGVAASLKEGYLSMHQK